MARFLASLIPITSALWPNRALVYLPASASGFSSSPLEHIFFIVPGFRQHLLAAPQTASNFVRCLLKKDLPSACDQYFTLQMLARIGVDLHVCTVDLKLLWEALTFSIRPYSGLVFDTRTADAVSRCTSCLNQKPMPTT